MMAATGAFCPCPLYILHMPRGIRKQPLGGVTIRSTRMDADAKLLQAHLIRCDLQAVLQGLLLLAESHWPLDPIVAVADHIVQL